MINCANIMGIAIPMMFPAILPFVKSLLSLIHIFVGQAPNLPEEVRVTYSDNTSGMIGLKWADIASSDYAQEGSFTVEGTVEGTSIKAI